MLLSATAIRFEPHTRVLAYQDFGDIYRYWIRNPPINDKEFHHYRRFLISRHLFMHFYYMTILFESYIGNGLHDSLVVLRRLCWWIIGFISIVSIVILLKLCPIVEYVKLLKVESKILDFKHFYPHPSYFSMDLILRLPRILRKHDLILILMDRLSKMLHFILCNKTINVSHVA